MFPDIRYALRMLVKSPGFTAVTVLTLALGIGANTAIFSAIHAILLRPLPFHDPERLVIVWEEATHIGFPRATPAPASYSDWKAQNHVFEDVAFLAFRSFYLRGEGQPERVSAAAVTASLFPLLGVKPFAGRVFRPEEDAPEAPKTAVVSYGLWQRRYAGDLGLIGRAIDLDSQKVVVVGIMPPGFQFLSEDVDVWAPAAMTPRDLANRGSHYLTVVARMKPGVSLAQAQADIDTVVQRVAKQDPQAARNAIVLPLREQLAGGAKATLIVLLVAVAGVLLIGCVNVANLLLSRGATRRREMALRAALGADRSRLLRQLLTESVLLAVVSGVAGLLVAGWSLGLIEKLVPAGMTGFARLRLDGQVLAFSLLISLLTGVIFGLAPALGASKLDLNEALKQGGGRLAGGAGRRLRSVLVVCEMALALVLLICAQLMIQTFLRLRAVDPGFRASHVLAVRTPLAPEYRELTKRTAFYEQVIERVARLPGVIAAGYTTALPLQFKGGTRGFAMEGKPVQPGQDALFRQITPGYLRALGIPLREGRSFEERDGPGAPRVAIINQTMARKFWPAENPIGKRFRPGPPEFPWITIVGVTADVKEMGLEAPAKAEFYVPCQQDETFSYAPGVLVMRTSGDPSALAAAVRREIWAVNKEQPIGNIRTMDEIVDGEMLQRRMQMSLLGAFAAVALLLAALGIYGVLSYTIAQRTQEIGIRMALGAERRRVLGMVIGDGMLLAGLGVVLGVPAALGATRLLATLLFGVKAWDPLTFALAPLVLIAVALAACYVPGRRAAKVDPMGALRYE